MNKKLSTDPYKGVRDFYPEDMAVQRYMFSVWEQTAESFGFERYDASILEPSELYRSKGAENTEIVNEQTYTFTDRGKREVTLRPEMTPTIARMVAGKRRELSFPLRWYSIPNLFRYERTQRGRLREHWQLNCDIFLSAMPTHAEQAGGTDDVSADVEIILLADAIFKNFGATEEMYEIRINDRSSLNKHLEDSGITEASAIRAVTAVIDKKNKMSKEDFKKALAESAGPNFSLPATEPEVVSKILEALKELGVTNAYYDSSIVRGFDYYTGAVFEIFDTNLENNRSMMGGGRYDNLTELFGGEAIPGVGFGFGDVTLRNFLENHDLLTSQFSAPDMMILPVDQSLNMEAEKVAQKFREAGLSVSVDMSNKKLGKKISTAGEAFVTYALILGEDEVKSSTYKVKNLAEESEISGTIEELINKLTTN